MIRYALLIALSALLVLPFPHPHPLPPRRAQDVTTIRMLVAGDPFALALQNSSPHLLTTDNIDLHIEQVAYADTRILILRNAADVASRYDLVSFDVLWLPEFADANALLPLDDFLSQNDGLNTDDFLPLAYTASAANGQQFGLPIQPHPELLWYRTDLFAEAALEPPRTTDDVLAAAVALHNPQEGQYGICWNAQRRQALGQTIAHFYAAFGGRILDADGQPQLDNDVGRAVATYALALLDVSPPDILLMAWDQRTRRFADGGCVMTYGWGARAYLVENRDTSRTAGLVGYVAAPHGPGAAPVTPLGTWSLGIPANIGDRADVAWQALAVLSAADTQYQLALAGNGGMPRLSIINHPVLSERYPAFATVATLSDAGQLQDGMRPAVSEWAALEIMLGSVFHDMLRGETTIDETLSLAQEEAERLMN